jgi:hypothetical protein
MAGTPFSASGDVKSEVGSGNAEVGKEKEGGRLRR